MSDASFGDYEFISATTDDPVDRASTVTVDRPDARNALGTTVREELSDAFAAAEAADGVRVLVLTESEEYGSFVAEADITDFVDRSVIKQREASKRPRIYEQADDLKIPAIVRINGQALGSSCELAMVCDIRLACPDAKLKEPEINFVIILGSGTQRLSRLVGKCHSVQLTLSGEVIDSMEAKEVELIDEVYEENTLDNRIAELAEMMVEKSPIALELGKEAVHATSRMNLDDGIKYEAELFVVAFRTEDKNEGIATFLENRDPEFTRQ